MIRQCEIQLQARPRGCHLVTDEVVRHLGALPQTGLLHLLLKHTSAGLCLNENWDADVRRDLNAILDHIVPENQSYFLHTLEGADDMPAHAKSALVGATLTIPITNGRQNLGTWQGIYLCEFRNHGGARTLTATIIG